MQRGSAIAVVAGAAGILIAGSAASVAVINAANSGTSNNDEPIVAASIAASDPSITDDANQIATDQQVVLPDPTVEDAPLPKVIVPSPVDIPDATPEPVTEPIAQATTESTPEATPEKVKESATPKSPSTPDATVEQTPELISARQARDAALAATPGTVLGTSLVKHAGYEAYAVQIERADGSVVTGFVEANTGVVYDWVVDRAAPKPAATYEDDDHDEYEDDDHDDDHDEYEDDDHDDDHDERDGDDD